MSEKKKQIRAEFRDACFLRDGNKCRVCGATGTLDSHHITDRAELPSGGYVKENGISLCQKCHVKAEVWHSSEKTKSEVGFHPNDLYVLIGSSYEKAIEASERL
jgi:5-methylcytosine-specific restriction endonuclease McrA